MEIKDLKLGDVVYVLEQKENGGYVISGHKVVEFGATARGEYIKFISGNSLVELDAKYCNKNFEQQAGAVEAQNEGYVVCRACGEVVEASVGIALGRVSLCDKCVEAAGKLYNGRQMSSGVVADEVGAVGSEEILDETSSFENGSYAGDVAVGPDRDIEIVKGEK